MNRLAATLCILASAPCWAQDSPPDVSIEHLSGPVYFIAGRGGNLAASIGDDGVVLVDDQFAPMTEPILAALATVTDRPVKFVLNTHWHGDHTGGNANLAELGAVIVAHDNVRRRMSTEQFSEFTRSSTPPAPDAALPVVTFSETLTVHINGEPVVAHHVPGAHTDGDSIIHFTESGVLHMGDAFWSGHYPRIDLETGATVQGMTAAAERGLALCAPGMRVIAGHGPLSGCGGLRDFLEMLQTTTARVRELMDAGHTLEEIIALEPNADYDATWGQWYIRPADYITFVYRSLQAP